jgi:hypothetical protein
MSTQELMSKINSELQELDKKELEVVLSLLRQLKEGSGKPFALFAHLQRILKEDHNLLNRLAQ